MNYMPSHPRLRALGKVADVFAEAAEVAARRVQSAWHVRRRGGNVRRPGVDTPLWNLLVVELRGALQPRGAKVRLARYLGIPKQRITNFISGRSRLPDAEITLRMLYWLVAQAEGRDPSL